MNTLQIYRAGEVIATIPVGMQVLYKYALMGEHLINAPGIVVNEPLPIQLNDYVIYKGVRFTINTVPNVKINHQLEYSIVFEAPKYKMHNKLFMDEGKLEFPYYGDALLHLNLLLDNINDIDPGWTLGVVDATVEQSTFFSKFSCYEALTKICEDFKVECYIQNKVINLVTKVGRDTNISFEYGRGKGLLDLQRTYVNDKNVVTKVFGFGGERNIQSSYRGGEPKLTFEERFLTKNTDLFGVIEGFYVNDEIYPHRDGTVDAVSDVLPTSTLFTITDQTLDFDLNTSFVAGSEPKILFKTGELAGEEFVITNYNNVTKVITYKSGETVNKVILPNTSLSANVGDKYTVVDINLPAKYVTDGELKVKTGTQEYLDDNSMPVVEYSGTINPIEYRDNGLELLPGDRIQTKDVKLGVDASIRMTSIAHPILFPEFLDSDTKIDVVLSNYITYTDQKRAKAELVTTKNELKVVSLKSAQLARRNTLNLFELRDSVVDPEGNYYGEKIKPNSIETLALSVGAKATNFRLSGITLNPNNLGNPNSFAISAGQLIHYSLKVGSEFFWEMQPFTINNLVPANKYFIYAKISRTNLVGTWLVSTEVKTAESEAGYYLLQAGVLYAVNEGRRDHDITSGMIFMIGDQITAGKIQSLDKQTYFDLTTGEIGGRIKFTSSSGALKLVSETDNTATLAQAYSLAAQITADDARDQAVLSLQKVNDMANDGILDVSEKVNALKDYRVIQGEIATNVASANNYSVFTVEYTDRYNDLANYLTPLFSDLTVNSPINRDQYILQWTNYYTARQKMLNAISLAAKGLIDNIQVGGRNLLPDSSFESGVIKVGNGTVLATITPASSTNAVNSVNGDRVYYMEGQGDVYSELINTSPAVISEKKYTVSYWYKMVGDIFTSSSYLYHNGQYRNLPLDSARQNEWVRASFEFTSETDNLGFLRFGFQSNGFAWLAIDCIQVEQGDLTDWQLAPEDIQKQINDINFGGVNLLKNSGDFANNSYWNGTQMLGNAPDGTLAIHGYIRSGNFYYNDRVVLKPDTVYTYQAELYLESTTGANQEYDPTYPLHIWLGAEFNNNELSSQMTRLSRDQTVNFNTWKRYFITFRTPSTGAPMYMRPWVYGGENGDFNYAYASHFMVAEESKPTAWKKSAFQITAETNARAEVAKSAAVQEANAFAESVASSKANAAQAAAQSTASNDAQNKANVAYNNAVSASNSYAQTVANNAASAAQVAAAADASNKASQSYSDAQSYANVQYNNLTGQLKTMAYRDIEAVDGVVKIDNGAVVAFRVDAAYIRANVINVGFIQGLDLNFVKGTIGGWVIDSDMLRSPGPVSVPIQSYKVLKLVAVDHSLVAERYISGRKWDAGSQQWITDGNYTLVSSVVNPDGIVVKSNGQVTGVSGVQASVHVEAYGGATHAIYASAAAGKYAAWLNGRVRISGSLELMDALSVTGGLTVSGPTVLNSVVLNIGGSGSTVRIDTAGQLYRG